MITTIQACEERLEYIRPIANEFNAIVHTDKNRINAYWSFKDMLDIDFEDYRFHLQDDVILANGLKSYIPTLLEYMAKYNIHLLSLFAPSRENFDEEYAKGVRICPYRNYLGNIGVIFSKYFVDMMKIYIKISSQHIDDDIFISETLSRLGIKGYVHLPILVQHNLELSSTIGHGKNAFYSNLFDVDFVTKLNLTT
jgi:hypothetical protein